MGWEVHLYCQERRYYMRKFTNEQIDWLGECYGIIRRYYVKGNNELYQWNLQRELKYISELLKMKSYDIHYDADRLNSYKALVGYIKNRI